MNELIKELAKEARLLTGWPIGEMELDKFAGLIVQECLKCSEPLTINYIDAHTEKEQSLLLAAIADYSSEIKKHFGVE